MAAWGASAPGMNASRQPDSEGGKDEMKPANESERKKIVVVGLGMVGIAFM